MSDGTVDVYNQDETNALIAAAQPDLATVATTGAYSDLTGKPTLGTAATHAATDFDTAGAAASAQAASQPVDSDLTAIAALTTAPYGRALLTMADASAVAAVSTQLVAGPGTNLVSGGTSGSPTITVTEILQPDGLLSNGEVAGDMAGGASGNSGDYGQTPVSGQLLLRFFRARNSWSAMKSLWFITKSTAPSGLTLVKGALFSWDATTLTRLDVTADLHSSFTGSFTGHKVALAGGTSNITQGSYYAIGLLQVGTTPGSLAGTDGFTSFQMGIGQNIKSLATPAAIVSGQSDMPTTIAASALSNAITPYLMACSVVNS